MALFNRSEDIDLINTINRELINDIIEQTVAIFKYQRDVTDTNSNLYGESATGKSYKPGVLVNCLIERGNQEWSDSEFGTDLNQTMTFSFLFDMLQETHNITIEIGDIIEYDNAYWEVGAAEQTQFWGGRNDRDPNQSHGEGIAIIATAHLTRRSRLGIENTHGTTDKGVK